MTAIDRQKLIEAAADAIHRSRCGRFHRPEGPSAVTVLMGHCPIARQAEEDATTAVPVIVAAALKPLRDLHREQLQFCRDCDEIEAAAKGGE